MSIKNLPPSFARILVIFGFSLIGVGLFQNFIFPSAEPPLGSYQVKVFSSDGLSFSNSTYFSQVPDQPDYFIGRVYQGALTKGNASYIDSQNRWTLALFKQTEPDTMIFVKNLIPALDSTESGSFKVLLNGIASQASGAVGNVNSAYDATIAKIGGAYWIAFECWGTGLGLSQGSCLAPLDAEGGIEQASLNLQRVSLVVQGGDVDQESGLVYSASRPKILSFAGEIFLFWSAIRYDFGKNEALGVSTRGMALLPQEMPQGQILWGANGKAPAKQSVLANDTQLSNEVLVPLANDPSANTVADLEQVFSLNNKIYGVFAVGGTSCVAPQTTGIGCYRLQMTYLKDDESPLAPKAFNRRNMISPSLPLNAIEHANVLVTGLGNMTLMAHLFPAVSVLGELPGGAYFYDEGFWSLPMNIDNFVFAENSLLITAEAGLELKPGNPLQLGTGQLVLSRQGNLAFVNRMGNTIWSSGTNMPNTCAAPDCKAIFEDDGNFGLYFKGQSIWPAKTTGVGGSSLQISNQSPVLQILDDTENILWSSSQSFNEFSLTTEQFINFGTAASPYFITMQSDGNLVIYNGQFGGAMEQVWESGTTQPEISNAYSAVFQSDGNLVIYKGEVPVAGSNTPGVGRVFVFSKSEPFLQILNSRGQKIWDSAAGFLKY